MEKLVKYLFIFGLILLVVAGVLWDSIMADITWRAAVSFLLISIGAKELWLKK